jgi:outer membrane biosynthesis protein TonB
VRYGLIGSIILHIVIFGLVIFNFARRGSDAPAPAVPVSVEFMTPKDSSERQAGIAEGKAEKSVPPASMKAPEAQAAAKKEIVEQKPVPKPAEKESLAPPPPAPPTPVPAAKPVEVVKADPPSEKPADKPASKPVTKKEPKPKPPARPKLELAKKPDSAESKRAEARPEPAFDPAKIAADLHRNEADTASQYRTAPPTMATVPAKVYSDRQTAVLNRSPDTGSVSGEYDPSKPWRPASSLQDQAMGVPGARGAMNASSCADAVQSRIEQNWILPIGGAAAETAVIRLHIILKRDGFLSSPPAVMDPAYSPVQRAMADAAVRAAESGQPYSIPPQQYEQCRDMILRFNPREMYGG